MSLVLSLVDFVAFTVRMRVIQDDAVSRRSPLLRFRLSISCSKLSLTDTTGSLTALHSLSQFLKNHFSR